MDSIEINGGHMELIGGLTNEASGQLFLDFPNRWPEKNRGQERQNAGQSSGLITFVMGGKVG